MLMLWKSLCRQIVQVLKYFWNAIAATSSPITITNTLIHQANINLWFVLNEYACVAYILGYLTKIESGLTRLLHEIEVESAKYGRTPGKKMKLFSTTLDISREVSRPEVVNRMLGLHFCSHPSHTCVHSNNASQWAWWPDERQSCRIWRKWKLFL